MHTTSWLWLVDSKILHLRGAEYDVRIWLLHWGDELVGRSEHNNISTAQSYKYHGICQREGNGEFHRVFWTSSKAHVHPYWIHRQSRQGGITHLLDSVPMEYTVWHYS